MSFTPDLFVPALASPAEVLDGTGDLLYWPGALSRARADALLVGLSRDLDWARREITLFGRRVPQPRQVAWYGDPGVRYRYSGLTLTADGWPSALADLRNELKNALGLRFNSVLCNRYRDGGDSMGWHADDEPELGPAPVIASLSLGAPRRFLLKSVLGPARRIAIELGHGSLLLMRGEAQRRWRHALPKTRKAVDERINLTFRRILSGPG